MIRWVCSSETNSIVLSSLLVAATTERTTSMSLLLSRAKRDKALVLLSSAALLATFTLPGASPASATPGVTVTHLATTCSALFRQVTNNSSQVIYVYVYETMNGQRVDYIPRFEVAPGQSENFNTMRLYFTQSLGIRTGALVAQPNTPPTVEWTDWGATDFVTPSDCPPMIAPAKVTTRTKSISAKPRPVIWFKTKAYSTDFGYRVGNGKIKWTARFAKVGVNVASGPFMKPGQRLQLKFYSRNVDDSESTTDPVMVGKKWFTRSR